MATSAEGYARPAVSLLKAYSANLPPPIELRPSDRIGRILLKATGAVVVTVFVVPLLLTQAFDTGGGQSTRNELASKALDDCDRAANSVASATGSLVGKRALPIDLILLQHSSADEIDLGCARKGAPATQLGGGAVSFFSAYKRTSPLTPAYYDLVSKAGALLTMKSEVDVDKAVRSCLRNAASNSDKTERLLLGVFPVLCTDGADGMSAFRVSIQAPFE